MARFNIVYYLFAVFAVLALVANARPASPQPNTGDVAGMPGMATEFDQGGNANTNSGQKIQQTQGMTDSEKEYMNDMEKALDAAKKAAANATPTSAPSRPTPGVPTTAPSQTSAKAQPAAQATPSASAPAKSSNLLSNVPLVGSLLGSVPI